MQELHNFIELGKVFGLSPRKRKEKPFVCRKCGEVMKHISGTNVFLCEGKLPDGKECGNRVFTKSIA